MLEHAQADKLLVNLTRSESTANAAGMAEESETEGATEGPVDAELSVKLVNIVSDQVR